VDVFGADLRGPAVLFIHGGGFVAGDKRPDELFYANIGLHFAARGVQALLMTYRLAPASTWPGGADDVQRAVTWARESLGAGTRDRPMVVIAQTAGACHAASYLFREESRAHAKSHIAGCALMSGVYDAAGLRSPGAAAYFGTDEAQLKSRAPASHVTACAVPLLVTVSEFDPPAIAAQGFGLARTLTEASGRTPEFRWFRDHNHVSTVHSLGSGQEDVAEVLDEFVDRCAAR
jgi:acetyl esterase/lipase